MKSEVLLEGYSSKNKKQSYLRAHTCAKMVITSILMFIPLDRILENS